MVVAQLRKEACIKRMPVSESIKTIIVSRREEKNLWGIFLRALNIKCFKEYVESNQKFDNLAQATKDKNIKDKDNNDPFKENTMKYQGLRCTIS